MSVQVTPFTMADYEEVVAFWRTQEGIGLNESDAPDPMACYLRRNPGLSLVARDRGAVVGAVLCGHDGRRGYLHHLAIAPSHRRKGLGRQLVEQCLERLREAGIPKCNIFLFDDNSAGEVFWRTLGFNRREWRVLQRQTT